MTLRDPPPAKNPTRQLVGIAPDKISCTILFMPFSEFHDFRLTPNGTLPAKVTSTSTSTSTTATANDGQGAYFMKHVYLLNAGTGMYGKTPSCYRGRCGYAGKEKVDCNME